MTLTRTTLICLFGLIPGAANLHAHHGRGATYDLDSEIEIRGVVTELVWRNPHVAIMIEVAESGAEPVTWVIEHSNVSTLARMGYHRNTLRAGQRVTAVVNPGSTGDPVGLCQRIVLEDGTVIFIRGESVD